MMAVLKQWILNEFFAVCDPWVLRSLAVIILASIVFFKSTCPSPARDRVKVRQYRNRGPKIYPLIGSQFELLKNLDRIYDWATTYLHNDPTHTIRLSRPLTSAYVVATANHENVEYMLKTNFANYPKGSTILHGLRPFLGDGIFNADGETWRSQRKVASFEFSTKTLRDFVVKLVHGETYNRLMPLLAKANSEGSVIDLQDLLVRFGFDNICLLGFGVDIGCLDPSLPEVEIATAFDEATRLTFQRLLISPIFYPLTAFLASFGIGHESKLNKLIEHVDRFALSIIQKRRKELQTRVHGTESKFSEGHGDLLSRFIQYDEVVNLGRNSQGQKNASHKDVTTMSDKYLRDIILNFILAGRDTSSVALTWFFWLLSQYPEVEKNIVAEVKSILQARTQSLQVNGSTKEVEGFNYDELKEMHYVQAAITESMRLYPPVPVDSKTALEDDYFPDGTFIQKGDRVTYHTYAMGRLEDLWGKDCLEFKPERFLQDGIFVPETSFKYPIFQAGPRICLGKEMAYTQMKYIVAAIFTSPYRLKLVPNQNVQTGLSLTLKMKDGLRCTIEKIED